jgi:hypothetical protein
MTSLIILNGTVQGINRMAVGSIPGFLVFSARRTQGAVVGQFATPKDAGTHGFLPFNGTYTTIDFPGGTYTVTSDINNLGVIVGDY